MAYATFNKPSLHFNTKTYSGNGGTQAITGLGFQPDMVWIKKRNGTTNHHLVDVARGVGYYIYPNLSNAQGGNGSTLITAFGTDGWTMDSGADSNASGATGVGWAWKAGNSAGSSNTDGSINTTTTSVNSSAGFSISTYTGNGSSPATIGHGLGVAPTTVWIKRLSNADGMIVYHESYGNNASVKMDRDGTSEGNFLNSVSPTSTVVSVTNSTECNTNGQAYVMYCFAEKKGYSKFHKYIGNGSSDGNFCYTGFKPAFVMVKNITATAIWMLYDNKRDTENPNTKALMPNENYAEDANAENIDFLSNGFKCRGTGVKLNNSGQTFLYWAFASLPTVINVGQSFPATAE